MSREEAVSRRQSVVYSQEAGVRSRESGGKRREVGGWRVELCDQLNLSGLLIIYQISFPTSSFFVVRRLYCSAVRYLQSCAKSIQTCVSAFSVSQSFSLLMK